MNTYYRVFRSLLNRKTVIGEMEGVQYGADRVRLTTSSQASGYRNIVPSSELKLDPQNAYDQYVKELDEEIQDLMQKLGRLNTRRRELPAFSEMPIVKAE